MYLTYEKHTMFKSYVKGFIAPVELKVSFQKEKLVKFLDTVLKNVNLKFLFNLRYQHQ